MSYDYQTMRARVFTEDGQRMFLAIRDRADALLREGGAVRLQEAIRGVAGDMWEMLACVDRLVELGELRELSVGSGGPAQHRVFVKGNL